MIINEKQLEVIANLIHDYAKSTAIEENFGAYHTEYYFFQDEEMKDSSISLHIHFWDGVEIINIDEYGDCVFKMWD